MAKLKKWQIITIVVIALLAFTNPTQKDCDDRFGKGGHRTAYFLVCSIYEKDIYAPIRDFDEPPIDHKKYVGIFKNFIFLEPHREPFDPIAEKMRQDSITRVIEDSTAAAQAAAGEKAREDSLEALRWAESQKRHPH